MLDLSTIGVAFDTSGLEKGTAALKNAEQAANKTADAADKVGSASAPSFNKAASSAESAMGSFRKMAEAMTVASVATLALEKAMAQVGKVLAYLEDAAKLAARYETLGVVMQTVGRNAGYTGQQMLDAAKGVQAMGITMLESRDSVAKMASAQIDLTKAQGLARIAQDAAVIGGINSSEAFKSMIYGIQSAQTEVLRTIGINVNFESSYKKLALQLGTTAEALTEQEKTTARTNAVMEAGGKIAGAYEDAMGTAGKQLTSMARYSEDAKVKLGAVFSDTLLLAVATYTDHLKDTNKSLDELAKNDAMEEWSNRLAVTFAFVADSMKNSFSVVTTVIDTIYTAMKQANALASFRFNDVMKAGDDWQARNSDRFDPQGQMQVQYQQLQEKKANDAKTLHMPDKSVIVFETPEQRQAYQDGLAGIKKYMDDRQKAVDVAGEAMAAALKKNRTQKQKTEDEISRFRKTQADAGVDLNSPEVKQAEAAISAHGKEVKAVKEKVTEYDRLMKSISEKIAADRLDIDTEGKLTAGQREAIKVMDDLRTGTLKFVATQKMSVDDQKRALTASLELRLATEAEKTAHEGASKAVKEALEYSVKLTQAHNDATAAAQAYIDTVNRQNARELGGIGKGNAFRKDQAALNTIEDKLTSERNKAVRDKDNNKIDQSAYEGRLAIATKSYDDEVAAYLDTRRKIRAAQGEWQSGASEAFANYSDSIKDVAKSTESLFTNAFKGMEDALVSFVKTSKLDFSSLADSIISDMIRMMVQQNITKPLAAMGNSFIASMFSANGNAFGSDGVHAFANGGAFSNSIVSSPTAFAFAKGGGFGLGVMGEAGDEAVMPLTRGANGKLGVQSSGGGGNSVVVNIAPPQGYEAQQSRRTENGVDFVDVMFQKFDSRMAAGISRGGIQTSAAMQRTYNLNRAPGAY